MKTFNEQELNYLIKKYELDLKFLQTKIDTLYEIYNNYKFEEVTSK